MPKYNTKDKEPRHKLTIEIFCATEIECRLSFTDTLHGANMCMYCGRLCCPCFISEEDPDLCLPCQEEEEEECQSV
jgi:hypothetical protein